MPWVVRHVESGRFVWFGRPGKFDTDSCPPPTDAAYGNHLRDNPLEATLFEDKRQALSGICEDEEVVDLLKVLLTEPGVLDKLGGRT